MRERNSVQVLNRFSGHLMQFISMLRKNHLGKLSTLGPGSALREKGEKSQGGWKKKTIGERSEPRGSLGRVKGSRAWRRAFDAADPSSSN